MSLMPLGPREAGVTSSIALLWQSLFWQEEHPAHCSPGEGLLPNWQRAVLSSQLLLPHLLLPKKVIATELQLVALEGCAPDPVRCPGHPSGPHCSPLLPLNSSPSPLPERERQLLQHSCTPAAVMHLGVKGKGSFLSNVLYTEHKGSTPKPTPLSATPLPQWLSPLSELSHVP